MIRGRLLRVVWCLACCGSVLCTGSVQAQDEEARAPQLAAAFTDGLRAYEAAQYEQAEQRFLEIFEAAPTFFQPGSGSAAYWLGRTFHTLNRPDAAVDVWRKGWAALAQEEIVDPRLADAFVWHVFEARDSVRYEAAEALYLVLLENLDGTLPADLHALKVRHLLPLALVLPEEVRAQTGLTEAEALGPEGLAEGTGAQLAAWWRQADVLPATRRNERLVEHLERVTYASRHFREEQSEAGFDDRGKVYIRLGKPYRKTSVTFDVMELGRLKIEGRLHLIPVTASFAENEFWVYSHVDAAAQYLFIRKPGKGYRLGEPYDLIPSEIRSGMANPSRPEKTRGFLKVLEDLYGKLALYHPHGHFGPLYDNIANYVVDLEMSEFSASLGGTPSPMVLSQQPHIFAQSALAQARFEDRRAARQRDEQVPPSYSNLFDRVEPLPVALRWARFLDEDGTTRTELYWSLKAEALLPTRRLRRRLQREGYEPSTDFLLDLTAVQQTEDYRPRAKSRKRHLVSGVLEDDGTGALPAQSLVLHGDTGRYHLALQWDAFWVDMEAGDEGGVQRGPALKVGSYRVDTLEALPGDAGRLVMSDLKPLHLPDAAGPEAASPYPNAGLTPATALGLYFEVYHLNPDRDGQTRYTVGYEMTRRAQRGGLLRVPRRTEESRTAALTPYTGTGRTARETILLDLSGWEGGGELEITVHVTDETTGQRAERSVSFELHD